jgi:hypothetical protein
MATSHPLIVYRYRKPDLGILTLRNRKFGYSNPRVFTDPMDCYFDTYWQLRCPSQAEIIFKQILSIIHEDKLDVSRFYYNISRDLWSQEIAKYRSNNDIATIRAVVDELMSDPNGDKSASWLELLGKTRQQLRIMCCSRDATSPAMWSHYAEAHTGLVLQIEVDKLGLPGNIIHGDVEYWERLPKIISDSELIDYILYGQPVAEPTMQKAWLLNKGREWQYEKEYRIAFSEPVDNPDFSQRDYKTECINSVFLGYRCCKKTQHEVLEIAKVWPSSISVFSAKPSRDSFRVKPDAELLFQKNV